MPIFTLITSFFYLVFFSRDQHTKLNTKKMPENQHLVQLSNPRPYSQLSSVAHQKKTSFSVCNTAKLGIEPGDKAACIVEPYSATRLPISKFWAKVITFICAHGHVHSHSVWAEKTLQTYGFPIQTYGETFWKCLIQRCKSKFFQVKLLVLSQSAYPYKNYVLKCPHEFDKLFKSFFSYKLNQDVPLCTLG